MVRRLTTGQSLGVMEEPAVNQRELDLDVNSVKR
jgi:hypothetical protein